MKKPFYKLLFIIVATTGLAFWTCQPEKDRSIYVAVSKYLDTEQYSAYKAWLHDLDSSIVLVDMYHIPLDSALMLLEKCSGLLMSGGADVHPAYYGQPEDTVLCEIDYYRDTVEMAILARASWLEMPVFGICRGLQVINVFMGGSLYPDIPERFSTSLNHRAEDRSFDLMHPVTVLNNSKLHAITGIATHYVNSSHHQGIDRLAQGLFASAHSPDTLIEAFERTNPEQLPFLMAVQWHPERLGHDHPLSGPLAKEFVNAVKEYHKLRKSK